jgi:23S rRNA (uracil1939-C5)-methyltransferase
LALRLKAGIRPKMREVCERLLRTGDFRGLVLSPKEGAAELFGKPVLRTPASGAEGVWLYERPDVFSQAGEGANPALVEAALSLAGVLPEDRVLELYCGNGNLTFAFAQRAKQMTAVESNAAALVLARRSANEARREGIRFVQGDAAKVCQGLISEGCAYDLVLVDPPRTGARGLALWAEQLGARAVLYVACDPAALARDAKELEARGFIANAVQVLDLFPYTRHVEAVASFSRRAPPPG